MSVRLSVSLFIQFFWRYLKNFQISLWNLEQVEKQVFKWYRFNLTIAAFDHVLNNTKELMHGLSKVSFAF